MTENEAIATLALTNDIAAQDKFLALPNRDELTVALATKGLARTRMTKRYIKFLPTAAALAQAKEILAR
jgi:hypothetical protein